ncbi:hypothetical protein A11A3_13870 [Alcanivorax hongdengensis A-11-3]|uniref:Uncharacterized protein n=2 Tax=Alcanivorax hongdengensis TaxID=519051 RepID=L0WCJ2_9GAMM|nr:hypothetical protein A11A3_13870 [Alcanivorax hongdengensis A-11-3]
MSYKVGIGLASELDRSAEKISKAISAGNLDEARKEIAYYRKMLSSVTEELAKVPEPLTIQIMMLEEKLEEQHNKANP